MQILDGSFRSSAEHVPLESEPEVTIRIPDVSSPASSASDGSRKPTWRSEGASSRASLIGFILVLTLLVVVVLRTSNQDERYDSSPSQSTAGTAEVANQESAPRWQGPTLTARRPTANRAMDAATPTEVEAIELDAQPTKESAPAGVLEGLRQEKPHVANPPAYEGTLSAPTAPRKADDNLPVPAAKETLSRAPTAESVRELLKERIAAAEANSAAEAAYEQVRYTQQNALHEAEMKLVEASEQLTYCQNKLSHANRMVMKGRLAPARRDALQFPLERAQLDYQQAVVDRDRAAAGAGNDALRQAALRRDAAALRLQTAEAAYEFAMSQLTESSPQTAQAILASEQSMWEAAPAETAALPVIVSPGAASISRGQTASGRPSPF